MKNSNDTIGNRTRDLPTCGAVPQPTAPPRAPLYNKPIKYFVSPSTVLGDLHKAVTVALFTSGKDAISLILLNKEEQSLEAAQMRFLRHLLGITKLDKEKNQCIRGKTGAQNTVKK